MQPRLLVLLALGLALCARLAAGQAWTPLVVEPCAAQSQAPSQYFSLDCSSGGSGCVYHSAHDASLCIYTPGLDNFLYLAACSDAQQRFRWGRGEGGFVSGKGGCWTETAAAPGGPAGDAVGLFGCGPAQGVFYLQQSTGNLTRIYSNASGLCLDAQH